MKSNTHEVSKGYYLEPVF